MKLIPIILMLMIWSCTAPDLAEPIIQCTHYLKLRPELDRIEIKISSDLDYATVTRTNGRETITDKYSKDYFKCITLSLLDGVNTVVIEAENVCEYQF